MSEKDTKDSVQNEQFGNAEDKKGIPDLDKTAESAENKQEASGSETTPAVDLTSGTVENQDDKQPAVRAEESKEEEHAGTDSPAPNQIISSENATQLAEEDAGKQAPESKSVEDVPDRDKENSGDVDTAEDITTEVEAGDVKKPLEKVVPGTESEMDESTKTKSDEKDAAPEIIPEKEIIDYTKLSREDLVKVLKDLVDQYVGDDMRKDIEAIKSNFYRSLKAENEQIQKKFLEEGGQPEDFKIEEHPEEKNLKDLLNKYRNLRNELAKTHEQEKEKNLQEKYDIIESIKELVNSQESLNKTFHDFRELQNRWREVGPVPQGNVKNLWESYHYQVEAFYDYIKINKELRDLDLKKNLEAKIVLCETAESLLLEPSVVEAFRRLQKLHDQWREVGPVPIDKRSETWERFKEATTKINRKHQEYFVSLKQEQKKNYEEKVVLCEKAEELCSVIPENHKDWEVKSNELIELQKVWKTIGFAPKKYNNLIYERFRSACDSFFNKKREFYSHSREDQQNNLQLKTELCIQAEALKDSTDWKKTTDEFIALQKKWKEIGPTSLKHSDKIWKRFRAACDVFFNAKKEYYSEIDSHYEKNLNLKNKLIEEIEKLKLTDDVEANLKVLKELQRKWSEIGYVPIKNKNEIQERYRKAINDKFDKLKLDDSRKSVIKFKGKLENLKNKSNAQHRISSERDKCFNKLKQLENDIAVWENNIGFFSNSDGAESMISDVKQKIENGKKKIEELKNKIRILDDFD